MFLFDRSVQVFDYTQKTSQKLQEPPAPDQCAKVKYIFSEGFLGAHLPALLYAGEFASVLEA